MENQNQKPKMLLEGILEGDLLLLQLTDDSLKRAFVADVLSNSNGQPVAFDTDQGMIPLNQIKNINVGMINYITLNQRKEMFIEPTSEAPVAETQPATNANTDEPIVGC